MPEPPVAWSTAALLAALRDAREATTLSDLRAGVAALRTAVAHGQPSAGLEDDAILLTEAYLLAELAQISAAQTLERARYYLDRLAKALSEERTSLINDLNLNRWKEYDDILTDSWWQIERRERSGAHSADYWGNFVPQIPNQMMRRYTKRGEWVLDVFAGSGTTLIEAQRLGRNCLGVELQPEVAERARQRVAAEPSPHGVVCALETGDSGSVDYQALLRQHGHATVQLVIMHPPYHDIIRFSDDARDLSNAPSVEAFLQQMRQIAARVAPVLDRGRYLVLVIGDKYARGEWTPLGFRAMEAVQQEGFALKSIVVKNFDVTTAKRTQKELWRYRALAGGFYVFKHEYIFVFKKK